MTGDQVRRFDPDTRTWESFTADDIGYEPLEGPEERYEPGRFLTDVALDHAGNVWVANCIFVGIGYHGQGVRWFDGDAWHGSDDTAGQCVQDIDVDSQGRVWMTGFDALIQYDPAAHTWTRFPLPEWERTQLIGEIILDNDDVPWITFVRYGGAGPWHSNGVFYLMAGGEWARVYDPFIDIYVLLAAGPDGAIWMCTEGAVSRMTKEDGLEAVGLLRTRCRQMDVDGSGRLWLVVAAGRDIPELWWYEREATDD